MAEREQQGGAGERRRVLRLPLLYRYVLREIAGPFTLALFVFTGILFLARILKLVDLVINKSVPVGEIITLFLLVIPQFLEFAVPMALLLGVILGFGRLSSSSELVVMRAMGISLRELLRPVMLFAAGATAASLLLGFYIRPWSNFQLGVGLFEIAKVRASAGLVSGVFNDFGALTIYAERVEDEGHHLKNVVIADRRSEENPRTFLAKFGQIASDGVSRNLTLNLYDGNIQEGRGMNYNVTHFDVNNIILNQSELADDATREGKKASEMVASELADARAVMNQKPQPLGQKDLLRQLRYDVEYYRRLVLPIACPFVALIALALGVQPARTGKSWGAALNLTAGIVSIGLYYLLLAFSTAMGEQAVLPVWFAMWLPNCVFAGIAIYFFRKMESEQWLAVSQAVADAVVEFFRRVGRRFVREGRG